MPSPPTRFFFAALLLLLLMLLLMLLLLLLLPPLPSSRRLDLSHYIDGALLVRAAAPAASVAAAWAVAAEEAMDPSERAAMADVALAVAQTDTAAEIGEWCRPRRQLYLYPARSRQLLVIHRRLLCP